MGMVDDFLKALDRIPLWKRLGQVPDEVDTLKRQVAAIEEKLNGKWPGDVCRYCGARASRLDSAPRGNEERWRCGECDKVDFRVRAER